MSNAASKLVILGIGDDGLPGLTGSARRTLAEADLILGTPSSLRLLEELPAQKVVLEPEMPAALRQVSEALDARKPVLVSSGDPLFYGVARYLAPAWARKASRSCLTSAACSLPLPESRKAGTTPT